MKITAKLLDHDVATRFGHASGPCVSPPEEEYRTETWEVTFVFRADEDPWDAIGDVLDDPHEATKEEIGPQTVIESWEFDDFGVADLRFVSPDEPGEYGSLIFTFGIIATQPFRRTGGSYERL